MFMNCCVYDGTYDDVHDGLCEVVCDEDGD